MDQYDSGYGSPRSNDGLLALLLEEQQQLTAVEEFSQQHSNGTLPSQAKYYSKLMPASPPGVGEQYAFEVNLDACSGCKACVVACHSLNGLDETETWRDVGLLIGGTATNPVMQHVTTACHHCIEPACMSACPVDAYEKDATTGIVRHLDDQCFGCQYCTLACPYDVPKYHSGKGIVRKCDMCADRLSAGEAPACVQSCPHEAISIKVVDIAQVRENAEVDPYLPGAPEPHFTYPTTSFKTERVFPRNVLPADYYAINPQHPHWPLIIMLVLTQLSVGAFAVGQVIEYVLNPDLIAAFRPFQSTLALVLGLLALGASTLHLGRPQYAFRAIIGLRHSWLSREIVGFGLFAAAATAYAAAVWFDSAIPGLHRSLGGLVLVSGGAGLFCSAMIYVFTQREFWSLQRTVTRFTLTSCVLGISTAWLALLLSTSFGGGAEELLRQLGRPLAASLMVSVAVKLVWEAALFLHLFDRRNTSLKRSARLMIGPLASHLLARFACGILGGIVMPGLLLAEASHTVTAGFDVKQFLIVLMLFTACLIGEMLERYLFFAAVSAPRMPGGPRT
ncbi:MAG: dimethyl sulfoxide reductase anchor subunit [Planctomycetaceae bacterium]|nr:dimethyl sulfoxide reductase anchor subunit [Planctomycetaceae bacterium]